MLAVADARIVASKADAMSLVVRVSRDNRPETSRAKEMLSDAGARILGVVVNACDASRNGSGYRRYAYTYKYADAYRAATDQQPEGNADSGGIGRKPSRTSAAGRTESI